MFFEVNAELVDKDLIQIVSHEDQRERPGDGSYNIVYDKLTSSHAYDSGYDRGKSTYNREETRGDHRYRTMLLVEDIGLEEVFSLEKKGILSLIEGMPTATAKPIADHIPYDGCQSYGGGYDGGIEQVTTGNTKGILDHRNRINARDKQKTIPGEEKAYKKSCLSKDDE